MMRPKINQLINLNNGLFEHIVNPPWKTSVIKKRFENDMYQNIDFLTSQGEKFASPFLKYFIKDGKISRQDMSIVMDIIYQKFQEQWTRKYAVLDLVYVIIDNYNMKETEHTDRSTLEESMRELMRISKDTAIQLNDLLSDTKNTGTNTNTKSGGDRTTSTNNETGTTTKELDTTDTLAFELRKDTEKTLGTKTDTTTATTTHGKTDTQTFLDRKDTTQHGLIVTNTGDDKKVTADKNTNTDTRTETQTFTDRKDVTANNTTKDLTFGDTGTGKIDKTAKVSETVAVSTSGYGSDTTVPMTSTKTDAPANTSSDSETRTFSKTEKGTVGESGSTTKTGTEVLTHGGTNIDDRAITDTTTHGLKVSNTGNDATTKSGSEVQSEGGTTALSHGGNIKDEVEVGLSKDGKEITTNIGTITDGIDRNSTETTETILGAVDTESLDTSIIKTDKGTTTTTTDIKDQENDTTNLNGSVMEDRTLERTGNIGVTTTTQLMQEHVDFWNYNYLNDVYNDIAGMLGLDIYG